MQAAADIEAPMDRPRWTDLTQVPVTALQCSCMSLPAVGIQETAMMQSKVPRSPVCRHPVSCGLDFSRGTLWGGISKESHICSSCAAGEAESGRQEDWSDSRTQCRT